MKNSTLLSILLFLSVISYAQSEHRTCSSHEHYAEMMKSHEFALQRAIIETQTSNYVSNPAKATRTIKYIPVVVHVVYNTASQNISSAQVQSQIDVLNADFRKLNADFNTNTPAYFQALAADCEIQFCLAQTDPNGNLTNGITRNSTTTVSFTINDNMKSEATGGANPWPSDKYLNIWVCKLAGASLGYAQFPGGPAATDGVVIATRAFGTIPSNQLSPTYNKGRTTTHEVGHWLNLFHTWGDDAGSCSGTDLVNDTPNQGSENYGCPTFPHITCSGDVYGDMFMNFMDYTNDACMSMFSLGQKARMDAMFEPGGARASLLTSNACNAPVVVLTTPCVTPQNFVITFPNNSTANIAWDSVYGSVSYTVQVKSVLASAIDPWLTYTTNTNSVVANGLTPGTSYLYQVKTNCSAGESLYSLQGLFRLSPQAANNPPPLTACQNNYEPNNNRSTSPIIDLNTDIFSMIGTNTDVDFYKIVTTNTAPKFKVTLTNLPADYDLKLYKQTGAVLGLSQNGITNSEAITYNNNNLGSTYYIGVIPFNGAHTDVACYTLKVETSAFNLKEDVLPIDEVEKPQINVYPVPTMNELYAGLYIEGGTSIESTIYNLLGSKISFQSNIATEGYNELKYNTSLLANGIYLLNINYGDEHKVQKFIVQH